MQSAIGFARCHAATDADQKARTRPRRNAGAERRSYAFSASPRPASQARWGPARCLGPQARIEAPIGASAPNRDGWAAQVILEFSRVAFVQPVFQGDPTYAGDVGYRGAIPRERCHWWPTEASSRYA